MNAKYLKVIDVECFKNVISSFSQTWLSFPPVLGRNSKPVVHHHLRTMNATQFEVREMERFEESFSLTTFSQKSV
jgi:hypothetical protein